jgi:hypothetical protein
MLRPTIYLPSTLLNYLRRTEPVRVNPSAENEPAGEVCQAA